MTPTHERWTRPDPGTHKWELRKEPGADVSATVWEESGWWMYSAPGSGFPKRGAKRVFRDAVRCAEESAK